MRINKTLLTTIIVFLLVVAATYGIILYAKGYRLNLSGNGTKILSGTGLLVLTSTPNGARVYLNNDFTTATDDTMNLPPGEYDVRIDKDGYYPWKKHVIIKKEDVTKTDAVLFPVAPKLEAASLLGAQNPIIDPTGSLIAYQVASSSAETNGISILNLGNGFILPFGSSTRQIASDNYDDFSKAQMEFSPDGSEMLATILAQTQNRIYLLKTDTFNDTPQNVTFTVDQVRQRWELMKDQLDEKFNASLPSKSRSFMLDNFTDMKLSPEGDKILYVASESAQMPHFINPPLPSTNSTPESRDLKKGYAYVYQIKEDKNYLLYSPAENETLPNFIWYPSSAHVVFVKDKRIYSMEFDGGNKIILYAGPFDPKFLYVWPDSSGIIILANFNDSSTPSNLYKVGLR